MNYNLYDNDIQEDNIAFSYIYIYKQSAYELRNIAVLNFEYESFCKSIRTKRHHSSWESSIAFAAIRIFVSTTDYGVFFKF